MAYNVADSFNRSTNSPKFTDEIFANLTARDAFASGLRYEGMTVYVVAEKKFFSLVNGITNSDWVEGAGGSGKGIEVAADQTDMEAIPTDDRYEGMIVYRLDTESYFALTGGITNADFKPFGGGGILSVADQTARDSIPSGERKEGMIVYVVADEKHYTLIGGITNAEWLVMLPPSTKGDIFIFGDGKLDKFAVGPDGTFLQPDSAAPTGLKWDYLPGPRTFGSIGAPRDITTGGITVALSHMSTTAVEQMIFVQSSTADNDRVISANPQIQAHTIVGAKMWLVGVDDTRTVNFKNGTGIVAPGGFQSKAGSLHLLIWDGSNWRLQRSE